MVGEVWLCSGQSNMDMRLSKLGSETVSEAEHPSLRLFRVERATSDEPLDDVDAGEGWSRCEPSVARMFSAVAYFMGRHLTGELDVPVGLIHTAYGGTPIEAWTRTEALSAHPETSPVLPRWDRRLKRYEEQRAQHEAAVAAGDTASRPPAEPPARYAPGGLYNAMVHPLVPYRVRGFVWYQGESNVWRAMQYRYLLKQMIGDWRTRWGDDRLPFGIVQLPNYANPPRVPRGVFSWPELRESQLLASQDHENVGLVVTIDVGDPTDIHPLDKETVGHRLALWALGDVHQHDLVYSGPMFRDAEFVDDKVYLSFDHLGSGLSTRESERLRGFIIAGADKKFRWAVAEIEGDRIVVSEKKVVRPRAVRYAWDDDPWWANLTNREGLPASPFRTDDWEGVTAGAR
ncbi:MAG: sialate O-acetylesterase [Planctomycetota bacterium]